MQRLELVLVVAIVAVLAGCSVYRSQQALGQEQVMLTAGFTLDPADTPAERTRLAALPQRRIVEQPGTDGERTYVYADPENCCCTYVGTAEQYAKYMALDAQIDRERKRDAEVVLFGDSAMDAHVAPDYPKLVPLPDNARDHGCPD